MALYFEGRVTATARALHAYTASSRKTHLHFFLNYFSLKISYTRRQAVLPQASGDDACAGLVLLNYVDDPAISNGLRCANLILV